MTTTNCQQIAATITEAIEALEREHEYDAEIGYLGDDEGGILSAYVPVSWLDDAEDLAQKHDAEFFLSHEVPELNEASVSFNLGNAKMEGNR